MSRESNYPPSKDAICTPYVGPDGKTYWEWNICPDCGKRGAHHYVLVDGQPREGIRCG